MSECEKIIAQYDEYFRQLKAQYESDLLHPIPNDWFTWDAIYDLCYSWNEPDLQPFDTSKLAIEFMNENGWYTEYEYTIISDNEFAVFTHGNFIKYRRVHHREELWVNEFRRTLQYEIDLDLLSEMRTAALAIGGCLG